MHTICIVGICFPARFSSPDLKEKHFDLATAFEVFEHLEDPSGVFNLLFKHADHLLITTSLLPSPAPALTDWWYYGPEHGQHISFYTIKSLQTIADAHQRFFYSNGRDFHFFSRKRISEYWFRKFTSERYSRWIGLWRRRQTLLDEDFLANRKNILAKLGYPNS